MVGFQIEAAGALEIHIIQAHGNGFVVNGSVIIDNNGSEMDSPGMVEVGRFGGGWNRPHALVSNYPPYKRDLENAPTAAGSGNFIWSQLRGITWHKEKGQKPQSQAGSRSRKPTFEQS